VGWGYSLANNSDTDWFLPTNLNPDVFSNGAPSLLFDFPILAPGDVVTEAFDPVNLVGLYELVWDASAPLGFVNSGNFVLSGQWWDGDPLNGGSLIADAPDTALPYTATVSGQGGTVPEPVGLGFLSLGIVLAATRRSKKCPRLGKSVA